MIVSCESCKSRYKLDDSKVTGRGAKITCPKCKHVFVVFAPPAPAAAPSRPNVAAAAGDDDDEGPTRIGGPTGRPPGAPVNTVSFGGGGGMESAVPAARANPTLAVPLPDMRAPDTHVVGHAPPPPPPSADVTVTPADTSARAAGLDFRKVGVTTWKVKVRIGLIYDFSDIKTLRKYITDGRVTPADVISHDGKVWKSIGEIQDLDAFFVQTYETLLRERGDAPAPAPRMPEPRVAAPVVEEPRGEPEPSTYRDPFDDMRARQREKGRKGAPATAAKDSSGSRTTPILLGLLGVVVIGGGLWYLSNSSGPTPTPAVAAPVKAEAAKTIRDQEREAIQQKLKDQFATVPSTDPAGDPAADVPLDPVATDPGVKVLADGRIVRAKVPGSASGSASSGATAVSSTPTAITPTPRDASATDYEAIGDAAAKSKDWKGATRGYQDAVNLDPGSGRLLKKLGEAQLRAGQLDAAQATLQTARSRGQKDAVKLLAGIAREQGDLSQANALYQEYLATGPKDAAEIEKILKEMNGG